MEEKKTMGYSRLVGCIYVFNFIVGTGVLALPSAFQKAGIVLSTVVLVVLAFLSFVTSTYVIEAMSISNAIKRLSKMKTEIKDQQSAIDGTVADNMEMKEIGSVNEALESDEKKQVEPNEKLKSEEDSNKVVVEESREVAVIQSYFEITHLFEMGQMAISFFNRFGLVLFYLVICVCLYGNLAVYGAAVSTTIRDVACTFRFNDTVHNSTGVMNTERVLTDSDLCWSSTNISRINSYRIFLSGFVLLVCPFVFFNLTKTKVIQFVTVTMRWFAFGIMFVLMAIYLAKGNRYGEVKMANFAMTPNLLGVSMFAFMCHHSLPSMVTPFNKKSNIFVLFFINFSLILGFYLVLALLSTFTFMDLKSLVTLNFQPGIQQNQPAITTIAFFQYYLSLFPVFSISATFPIMGITLSNNLRNLITCGSGLKHNSWIMENLFYPLLAIIPPIAIAFGTNNITFLVGFTGSYAGTFIQYVIPVALVICARRYLQVFIKDFKEQFSTHAEFADDQMVELYQSPFKHLVWKIILLIWSAVSIAFITVNYVLELRS